MNGEELYLEILRNILNNGVEKQPTRSGESVNSTRMLPWQTWHHDMSLGFPALTTRKVAFKSSMVELEGFINGITEKRWYKARGCNFWNYWACPPYVKDYAKEKGISEDDAAQIVDQLGPIYGYQWRMFNDNSSEEGDQFSTVLRKLKENPYDRRLVVSAWNPLQFHLMALPPCHVLWNVITYGDKIDLGWHQRSADVPIGVPHNITFYAMLLLLLAKHSGLKPGCLHATFADAHIYENQLDGVNEQLSRNPSPLPTVKFSDTIENGEFDIFQWMHTDVELVDYNPQPAIKFALTV
jgi:thymidylate synthase